MDKKRKFTNDWYVFSAFFFSIPEFDNRVGIAGFEFKVDWWSFSKTSESLHWKHNIQHLNDWSLNNQISALSDR